MKNAVGTVLGLRQAMIAFVLLVLLFGSASPISPTRVGTDQGGGKIIVNVYGYDNSSEIFASLLDENQTYLENKTLVTDTFSFDDVSVGESYFVLLYYKGVPYYELMAMNESTEMANITVFDITTDDTYVVSMFHHVIVEPQDNVIKVAEFLMYKNIGSKVIINGTQFHASLPNGYQNLQTSIMSCCLTEHPNGITFNVMDPIKPEFVHQISLRYDVYPTKSEYEFTRRAVYNTTSLAILVRKNDIMLRHPQNLEDKGEVTRNNEQYVLLAKEDLEKDADIGLTLYGFVVGEVGGEGIELVWLGAGLIVLTIVVVGAFSLRSRAPSKEDMLARKEAILSVLKRLEEDYSEGKISKKEYANLKATYEEEMSDLLKRLERLSEKGD